MTHRLKGLEPHTVLGLPTGASAEQARRAYRRLARRWHPDLNHETGAAEHFKQIQWAYEQLTRGRAVPADAGSTRPEHRNDADDPFLDFFTRMRHFGRK